MNGPSGIFSKINFFDYLLQLAMSSNLFLLVNFLRKLDQCRDQAQLSAIRQFFRCPDIGREKGEKSFPMGLPNGLPEPQIWQNPQSEKEQNKGDLKNWLKIEWRAWIFNAFGFQIVIQSRSQPFEKWNLVSLDHFKYKHLLLLVSCMKWFL